MFHSYKKSKFTNQKLWDDLEAYGFNQYELKHCCFDSDSSDDSGQGYGSGDDFEKAEFDALAREAGDFADVAGLGTRGAGMGPMGTAQSYTDPNQTAYDVTSEQVANQQQARDVELTYGVPYGSVTPAYETDPAGVQTISYPTFGMGLSEIGRGLGMGLSTFVDSMPGALSGLLGAVMGGPENTFRGTIGKAFGQEYTGKSLADQVEGAFRNIQSQAEVGNPEASQAAMQAEIDDAKEAMTDIQGSADDYMTEAQFNAGVQGPPDATDIQGLVDISPPTISEQVAAAPEGYNPAIGMADPNIAGLPGVSFEGNRSFGIANAVSPEAFESYINARADLKDLKGYEFGPEYGLSPTANMGLQPVGAVAPEQAQSAVDYYDVPTSKQQSSAPSPTASNIYSEDIYTSDGTEIIPRTVSKTPAAAPTPEPEVKVVREPVTRTPATDTFSILANIYGPEVAAQLLPNRIIA